jgi:hypothetical protein
VRLTAVHPTASSKCCLDFKPSGTTSSKATNLPGITGRSYYARSTHTRIDNRIRDSETLGARDFSAPNTSCHQSTAGKWVASRTLPHQLRARRSSSIFFEGRQRQPSIPHLTRGTAFLLGLRGPITLRQHLGHHVLTILGGPIRPCCLLICSAKRLTMCSRTKT